MSTEVFTDGSSRGNPGPGGYGAIIRAGEHVVELGGHDAHTTNNRMELSAVLAALLYFGERGISEATIYSDSKYVIQGMTAWIHGWQRNGWRTTAKKDVENRDLWERLASAAAGKVISYKHVDGHAGVPANERCDEIATGFADNAAPTLYDGPAKLYGVDLSVKAASAEGKASKPKKSSSAKAYSYLSLVDGGLSIDKTWADCERRVKGVRGAKFKKSISAEDEAGIKREWGVV